MEQYCGLSQRLLKLVVGFVDFRDLTVRNTREIVILENITCKRTTTFEPSDRNCLFFWREEWLKKIDSALACITY